MSMRVSSNFLPITRRQLLTKGAPAVLAYTGVATVVATSKPEKPTEPRSGDIWKCHPLASGAAVILLIKEVTPDRFTADRIYRGYGFHCRPDSHTYLRCEFDGFFRNGWTYLGTIEEIIGK